MSKSIDQKQQDLEKIYEYINHLHEVISFLQEKDLKHERNIDELEKRIETLLNLIDDLEREKWSIQSELENLRGY